MQELAERSINEYLFSDRCGSAGDADIPNGITRFFVAHREPGENFEGGSGLTHAGNPGRVVAPEAECLLAGVSHKPKRLKGLKSEFSHAV